MYFKFHIHWLRSYKIIILPFNFHFRNSGWAHCWEPSQSQRNSPQWLSCAWTAQELSTKSSWCCSWAGPLPGCNGSFQEVQILLSTLCFCLWLDECAVRFSVQSMPETWGTVAESGMRLKRTQKNMHGCVCEPTAWKKGGENKTHKFLKIFSQLIVEYGSVWAGAYPGECQPPHSACWKAPRVSPWIQLVLG